MGQIKSPADVRRETHNAAKRAAVRILWDAREKCAENSIEFHVLSHSIDHLITPEAWS